MKVTFLGTGTSQGVPIITCTCVVCSSKDPRDNRSEERRVGNEGRARGEQGHTKKWSDEIQMSD